MEVTEVSVRLTRKRRGKLRGYATVIFDGCFVVRDIRIIEGPEGPFVAMPSRMLTARCDRCRCKNHLRAKYCSGCGAELPERRPEPDSRGQAKLFVDVAHPVTRACREHLEKRIVEEYRRAAGSAGRERSPFAEEPPG